MPEIFVLWFAYLLWGRYVGMFIHLDEDPLHKVKMSQRKQAKTTA